MKKLMIAAAVVVFAVCAWASNEGLINIYLKVHGGGLDETDLYSSRAFDQSVPAFNAFTLAVGTTTNKISVPDVSTAGYAIFSNIGTAAVYGAVSGQSGAFLKIGTNEVSGPIRLATTNISFWTISGNSVVKGKVYAE